MTEIARYECPKAHGDSLTASREHKPDRWCAVCQMWVNPVLAEYVRADTHQEAIVALRNYGQHKRDCALVRDVENRPPCNCGFAGVAHRLDGAS